jgi:uncharacterized membrane protein
MGVYLMGFMYLLAGVMHFVKPGFFLKIVPPYLPNPNLLVALSGVAEIIFGALLFIPSTKLWAAWGIILLLIAVFPANLYMAYDPKFESISPFIRWGRLPIQLVLIWWAYQYTKI